MGKSSGKRKGQTGMYWCNMYLPDGKLKLCVAELINKELMVFRLWSNWSKRMTGTDWMQSIDRPGWWYKDFFEEDVNEFFDF